MMQRDNLKSSYLKSKNKCWLRDVLIQNWLTCLLSSLHIEVNLQLNRLFRFEMASWNMFGHSTKLGEKFTRIK